MCEVVRQACADFDERASGRDGPPTLIECFSPQFECRKKRMGTWYDTVRALLPGYVIADVRDPARLANALRGIGDFARVLAGDKTYSPLDEAERQWIETQSRETNRTIPLSFGRKEKGGRLVVTSGPLKGCETMITGIDRKNCMAKVEFHAGQITFKTTVGLAILPEKKAPQGQRPVKMGEVARKQPT